MSYEQTPETGLGDAGGKEPPANFLTDNAFGRLAGVLVSPTATFQSIGRRPTWVVALVVMLLISFVAQFVVVGKLDQTELREQTEQALEAQGQSIDDEALDSRLELQNKFMIGCVVVVLPIALVIMSLLFMVAMRMSGGEVSFVQSLSTVLHAMVPLLVSSLLLLVVTIGRTTPIGVLESQHHPLASNLSAFAAEGTSPVLLTVMSSFDLFSIWVVVLLILGFTAVARVKRSTATLVTLVLWAVWIAVKIGLAAVGQMFSGGGG